MTEFNRLMTITDLSEVLGVPVDTLYGCGTAAKARPATRSVLRSAVAGQPVEGGLDAQGDQRNK
jgi:hypothetical protein